MSMIQPPKESIVKRLFRDLPLGTRFRYITDDALGISQSVWVVLERHECGLVALWEGVNGPVAGQSLCSAAESEAECEALTVFIVE